MIYDLQFAESALKYIRTKDRSILKEIGSEL